MNGRKRNLIAHYIASSANSDKIYMACVRKEGTRFLVIGKWGRRGRSNLQAQVKLETRSEAEAHQEQLNLFTSKLREGYKNIDDPRYNGPVKRGDPEIRTNLEPEDDGAAVETPEVVTPKAPAQPDPKPAPAEDLVAVCQNNLGMEDKFDIGIEYVFEEHSDKGMIWVFDKFGKKAEFFKDRFKIQKGQ